MTELMIERIIIWPMWLFLGILLWAIFELLLGKVLGVCPDKLLQSVGLKAQIVMIGSILWMILLWCL